MTISNDELIDEHVSLKQCQKAVNALLAYELKKDAKRQEKELITAKEPHVWLNVTVKKMAPNAKVKPAKIPIKHPLVDPRTTPICLITKDPQREYKDLLAANNVKFIHRVVGITKLKGKWKPFEARRMLLKENGMFLADDRVIPLLPKLLGVKWFEAKKQPIPVCLTKKDLKGELERAVSSTYMTQNKGTCTSIKVGIISQKPEHILDNIRTALPAIIGRIQEGWQNVQALHIKTNTSAALPIWNCDLGSSEGARWDGLEVESDGDDVHEDAEGGSEDEEEVEKAPVERVSQGKGKKRTSDDQEPTASEKPTKKAKKADGQKKAASKEKKPIPAEEPSPTPPAPVLIKAKATANKKESPPSKEFEKETPLSLSGGKPTPGKKSKIAMKSSKGAPTEPLTPAKTSITQAELKQKRSSNVAEKKKEKLSKTAGGKSVKDGLLGKKAGRT